MKHPRLILGVPALGIALLSGCPFTGPDCVYELRNLQLETSFAGGYRVYLALDEERDAGSDHVTSRRMIWSVTGQLPGDQLTAVHLHRGDGGPVLASLPIQNARLDLVLTDGDVTEPAFITLSYDEFYAVMKTQPILVDFHTSSHPEGIPLGRLTITYDNPWVHPYCS